jgi:hypothetical protein
MTTVFHIPISTFAGSISDFFRVFCNYKFNFVWLFKVCYYMYIFNSKIAFAQALIVKIENSWKTIGVKMILRTLFFSNLGSTITKNNF